jgi:hypothetical protein
MGNQGLKAENEASEAPITPEELGNSYSIGFVI